MALSETDTMAVLASILTDPAAASARLKELNAARDAAKFAILDNEKKLKQIEKSEAEAAQYYKKASEERLAAARALKDAEDAKKKTQAILDKIGIREAEVSAREGEYELKATAQKKLEDDLRLQGRKLDEREAAATAQEKELATKAADLSKKLKALKDIAA